MTTTVPVSKGLAWLRRSGEGVCLELGQSKAAVAFDIEGLTMNGTKYAWPDVEALRMWLVPLPRLTRPGSWGRGYGNWRYGVWLAVLIKGHAFELQHRCGPVPKDVEDADAEGLAVLLGGLRDPARRAEFFASA